MKIEDEVYSTHYFVWQNEKGNGLTENNLTLHNRTIDDAFRVAKEFGYTQNKWYKPWMNNRHLYW